MLKKSLGMIKKRVHFSEIGRVKAQKNGLLVQSVFYLVAGTGLEPVTFGL